MKKLIDSNTQKKAALVSGFAIVIMAIAAVIANDATIRNLVVENNATETLTNILDSKTKYNLGVFSWVIVLICDLIVAWGLYMFFIPVNKNLSLITAWFRLIYVVMLAVSILNLMYVHLIIYQLESPSVGLFGEMSRNVMFCLNAFDEMWAVSLIVFGVHILLVGFMALKSGFVPKIFGVLLIIAFVGYTIPKISNLILPQYKDQMRNVEAIFLIPMLSEVALGVWLLFVGFRKK